MVLLIGALTIGIAQNKAKDSLTQVLHEIYAQKNFSTTDTTYINLLNKLSAEFTYHTSDSLKILTRQALKYSRESKYLTGESESLMNMGIYHSNRGESSNAISHYKEALKIAKDIENVEIRLKIINLLATEYNWAGDYAKSLDLFLEGTELAENSGHNRQLSVLLENLANLYSSQKDFDQAIFFYERVKKINLNIGNEISSAQTMANLASVYADMGNFEYAMFNVNSSIPIC